ncbi:type III secretion system protein [Anaerobacillus alkalidiazotrophicus]|uniref:Type III secretion system protein n=1 Tax=Anaerobacillus alkalidiazotrophicus TaxID=472963 RepID=A0A1S2LZD5_9BACI|nr:EscU/YscU/HrcU family type III secretion system export apparatus switch protein [Anaerobacillus alkalidiazotrophicus]OIJ17819.1 type III secretion system protein [Anaerobacillus alkalidiazotrophicus]
MNEKADRRLAVALKYNVDNDIAPSVLAKGKGYVAEELLNEAKKHNVPVQEDTSLVELLSQLEINQTIPKELYEVVAEIFAFVYQIDKSVKDTLK